MRFNPFKEKSWTHQSSKTLKQDGFVLIICPVLDHHKATYSSTLLNLLSVVKSLNQTNPKCCLNFYLTGLSRSVKYGLIIGARITIFLCISRFVWFISGSDGAYGPNSISATTSQQVAVVGTGLDEQTIDLTRRPCWAKVGGYPLRTMGLSPICLAKYQPKDTLRTITECNHYFHVHCIDD